jgi:serine/threonine protein kinase
MKHCPQCSTGYPDTLAACPTHGLPLNEIRDLKPGMVVHHSYRIVRKLGQGGMGAVYLAQHTLMDEPRALKFLSSELSGDREYTARFLREVRTLRQLRHRNVVDCGDLEAAEDGTLFFAMEFIDGPNLRDFLRDAPKPFDIPLALSIARGIAEGLGAAHSKGIVHRDIKPENILIVGEDNTWLPKIADFGCVAIKETNSALTRTRGAPMTKAYAAPEQWRGTPAAELDGRTDLYALGGVLYWMLTGQTVFKALNEWDWALQHMNTQPSLPSTLRPELANWQGLDALVLRLLAKDREDRPKDVAELIGLIDKCLIEMKAAEERRCKEKAAEEWLRKGLELQEAAPADPRGGGPINPYANPRTDLASQLQTTIAEYLRLVLAGTPPEVAAKNLGMTPEDQEMAHVAHFFMPYVFATIAGDSALATAQAGEKIDPRVPTSKVPAIPSPAGMDDGVLTQETIEKVGKIILQYQGIELETARRQAQLMKREGLLKEAFRCFECGYELNPNSPELSYRLAESYYQGNGVLENEEKAVDFYQRAADLGHVGAQKAIDW